MSRVFSIPTALRLFPANLLGRFFSELGHRAIARSCDGRDKFGIKPIQEAIGRLKSNTKLDEIERILHTVFDLACDTGMIAIFEAGSSGDRNLVDEIPDDGGLYGQAMWVWLNHPNVVDDATRIHQVDHLTWWRKRTDLPRRTPDKSSKTLRRLAALLAAQIAAEQGRGRICTVESMTRRGTEYFLAYPDDYLQTVTTHDARKHLKARTIRQTFLVAFAFDPHARTLELFAKLPAKLKGEIEATFVKTVLGADLDPWRPSVAYKLSHLKQRRGPLETEPADCVHVEIRQLHLKPKNSNRLIVLKADPTREGDIFVMLNEVLDKKRVPLSSLEVKMVTFSFEFLELGDRKTGSMTFNVAYPDKCNLRNHPQEWIDLAYKYLRLWKIDAN